MITSERSDQNDPMMWTWTWMWDDGVDTALFDRQSARCHGA
jgi:hypothetical protein